MVINYEIATGVKGRTNTNATKLEIKTKKPTDKKKWSA